MRFVSPALCLLLVRRGTYGWHGRGGQGGFSRMSLNAASTLAADELVEIVNEANEVIAGGARRADMRRDRLIHRATYAFVRTSDGLFYVQKRSLVKDYCPGYLDPTPGGVVGMGESFEETNRREVEEEMGIPASTPMKHLFTKYYEDERVRCFGDAWELIWDGPLMLQESEVESVQKLTMQDIIGRYEGGEPFTPDSMSFCFEYVARFGLPPLPETKPNSH